MRGNETWQLKAAGIGVPKMKVVTDNIDHMY
jgi:hypothetical protein